MTAVPAFAVRAAGTLLPQPEGSRIQGLLIRHQEHELHPMMSEKGTFEILNFSKRPMVFEFILIKRKYKDYSSSASRI